MLGKDCLNLFPVPPLSSWTIRSQRLNRRWGTVLRPQVAPICIALGQCEVSKKEEGFQVGKNHLNPRPRFHLHRRGCHLSRGTRSLGSSSSVRTQPPLVLHPAKKMGEADRSQIGTTGSCKQGVGKIPRTGSKNLGEDGRGFMGQSGQGKRQWRETRGWLDPDARVLKGTM